MAKKVLIIVAAIFIPLAMGGCSKGMIRADAIDGLVEKLTERHDKMLKGELKAEQISTEDKESFLRSSEILRQIVKEAKAH